MDDFDPTQLPQKPALHEPWGEDLVHWYVWNYGEHPFNHMAVDFAELQGDERVLDIGCGSGSALRYACRFLTGGRATGIDPSPAMIRVAERQSQNQELPQGISFHVSGAEALPLPDDSVDVAFAINSLHHWADQQAGLAEVRRVLAPTGRLILLEEVFPEKDRGLNPKALREILDPVLEIGNDTPLASGPDHAHIFQCYPTGSQ